MTTGSGERDLISPSRYRERVILRSLHASKVIRRCQNLLRSSMEPFVQPGEVQQAMEPATEKSEMHRNGGGFAKPLVLFSGHEGCCVSGRGEINGRFGEDRWHYERLDLWKK